MLALRPQWQTVFQLHRVVSAIAQQRSGAGEQFALEIGAEPITDNRNSRFIRQPRQLPHLILGQKLRLVHHDTGQRLNRMGSVDAVPQIGVGGKTVRISAQPDPTFDCHPVAAIIQLRGPQHGLHAAFTVIEIRLQQSG